MANFELDFISTRGAIMPLVDNDYFITTVDGMTETNIALSSSTVATIDGDSVNNTQAEPRTIVLYLEIRSGVNVEEAKRYILSYVKPKVNGVLRWRQNTRELEITGKVEAVSMPRFSEKCVMQITMHCEQPFWEDAVKVITEISGFINMHYFPKAEGGLSFPSDGIPFGEYDRIRMKNYTNAGDAAVGLVIHIQAFDTVTNPILHNIGTGQYISIRDTLSEGDEVIISTVKGEKSITKNGVNIIDKFAPGSSWLQLELGANAFMVDSEDTNKRNMYFEISFKQRYV